MLTLRRCSILASNKMSLACLVLACTQSGICSAPIFEPSSSNNKVVLCCFLISSIAKTFSKLICVGCGVVETYRIMQQITPIVIGGQTGSTLFKLNRCTRINQWRINGE
jgi:hypothetical protein